jgi:hypothetical protein
MYRKYLHIYYYKPSKQIYCTSRDTIPINIIDFSPTGRGKCWLIHGIKLGDKNMTDIFQPSQSTVRKEKIGRLVPTYIFHFKSRKTIQVFFVLNFEIKKKVKKAKSLSDKNTPQTHNFFIVVISVAEP